MNCLVEDILTDRTFPALQQFTGRLKSTIDEAGFVLIKNSTEESVHSSAKRRSRVHKIAISRILVVLDTLCRQSLIENKADPPFTTEARMILQYVLARADQFVAIIAPKFMSRRFLGTSFVVTPISSSSILDLCLRWVKCLTVHLISTSYG